MPLRQRISEIVAEACRRGVVLDVRSAAEGLVRRRDRRRVQAIADAIVREGLRQGAAIELRRDS